MSAAGTRERSTASTAVTDGAGERRNARLYWTIAILGSVLLAAISLAATRAIANDPDAWVVWARELVGPGRIQTSPVGPGWKPLPVLLIAPFALITRGNADVYWWLFLSRVGLFVGVFAAAAIARQYGGRVAAVLAAVMTVLSPWWLLDGMSGRAEPLCATFLMLAFLAHRRDWIKLASVLVVLTALIRPESWPFIGLYGLWLWRTKRIPFWYLVLGAVIVLGLWAVPEWHHTGSGALATDKNGGSAPNAAIYTAVPLLTIFKYAGQEMTALPMILAIIGVLFACFVTLHQLLPLRVPKPPEFIANVVSAPEVRLLAILGAAWITLVAVMTQAGFSGSSRYLDPPVALLVIVAAVVATRLITESAGADTRIWMRAMVVIVVVSVAWAAHGGLHVDLNTLRSRQRAIGHLRTRTAALTCPGPKTTGRDWFPVLAELTHQSMPASLDRHLRENSFRVVCAPSS